MESLAEAVSEKAERARALPQAARAVLQSQQVGLVVVLIVIGAALTMSAGSHVNPVSGATVNNFLNKYTLIQMATDASAFAIMGVGATIVIIAGAIDLSVGAIYALSGVTMAMVLRAAGPMGPTETVLLGLTTCLAVGLLCGLRSEERSCRESAQSRVSADTLIAVS